MERGAPCRKHLRVLASDNGTSWFGLLGESAGSCKHGDHAGMLIRFIRNRDLKTNVRRVELIKQGEVLVFGLENLQRLN